MFDKIKNAYRGFVDGFSGDYERETKQPVRKKRIPKKSYVSIEESKDKAIELETKLKQAERSFNAYKSEILEEAEGLAREGLVDSAKNLTNQAAMYDLAIDETRTLRGQLVPAKFELDNPIDEISKNLGPVVKGLESVLENLEGKNRKRSAQKNKLSTYLNKIQAVKETMRNKNASKTKSYVPPRDIQDKSNEYLNAITHKIALEEEQNPRTVKEVLDYQKNDFKVLED